MIDLNYIFHLEKENKDMEVKIISYLILLDKHLKDLEYLGYKQTADLLLQEYKQHFGISEQRGGNIDNN